MTLDARGAFVGELIATRTGGVESRRARARRERASSRPKETTVPHPRRGRRGHAPPQAGPTTYYTIPHRGTRCTTTLRHRGRIPGWVRRPAGTKVTYHAPRAPRARRSFIIRKLTAESWMIGDKCEVRTECTTYTLETLEFRPHAHRSPESQSAKARGAKGKCRIRTDSGGARPPMLPLHQLPILSWPARSRTASNGVSIRLHPLHLHMINGSRSVVEGPSKVAGGLEPFQAETRLDDTHTPRDQWKLRRELNSDLRAENAASCPLDHRAR